MTQDDVKLVAQRVLDRRTRRKELMEKIEAEDLFGLESPELIELEKLAAMDASAATTLAKHVLGIDDAD